MRKKKNRGKRGKDEEQEGKEQEGSGKKREGRLNVVETTKSKRAAERKASLSEIEKRERERKRREAEDSSGTGDDGGQKTSKTEAREPRLELSTSSSYLVPPCLVSLRLACACQLATRRQTHPSLSFVLMPTRLHASSVSSQVVVFLLPSPNLTLTLVAHSFRLLVERLSLPLRSRFSLPRSRERSAPVSQPLFASSERASRDLPSAAKIRQKLIVRPQLFNSSTLNF